MREAPRAIAGASVAVRVSLDALMRRLPAPDPRAPAALGERRARALEALQAEGAVEPVFAYRIVALDAAGPDALVADGRRLHAPQLLPPSGTLEAVGIVVCTLGAGVERRVRAYFTARRPSSALALEGLANELLFALADRAQERLTLTALRGGRTVAGELRPGDPGMDLGAQSDLLGLAEAHAIGVRATAGGALSPLASSTSVHGVGRGLPAATWSRCDRCPSAPRCALRARQLAAAGAREGDA